MLSYDSGLFLWSYFERDRVIYLYIICLDDHLNVNNYNTFAAFLALIKQ